MYCYEDAFSLSIVKDTNMNYCILSNENTISNIIVCENDEIAYQFGAVPSYDGAKIGDPYDPPPAPEPEPTLDDRVSTLEATKADQTDVDELNEALNMILTGYTGEEAADETGA